MESGRMRVLDLWCGTKSATKAFKQAGYEVISVDINQKFNPTICKDILDIKVDDLIDYGPFVFGWASPECKVYSIANHKARHWKKTEFQTVALTKEAKDQNERVKHTIGLLEILCPTWVLENPMGMLRNQSFMKPWTRHHITYCTYGTDYMKPTDLWGRFPRTWLPRLPCKINMSCHESAPRGTGNKGVLKGSWEERIKVPYLLSQSLLEACEESEFKPVPSLRDF
jgi:hypothetical protein